MSDFSVDSRDVPNFENMNYLDNAYLEQIDDGRNFWFLFDELCDDDSNFLNNRNIIVDAFKEGNIYGLRVTETNEMYLKKARNDPIFCPESQYLLPCFCIKEGKDTASIIWVHSRARRMGFGKKLVQLLKIKSVRSPLPESLVFWKKCGIK